MAIIKQGDLGFPQKTNNGRIVVSKASAPLKSGDCLIPAVCVDGRIICLKVTSMKNTGNLGLAGTAHIDGVDVALRFSRLSHNAMVMIFIDESHNSYFYPEVRCSVEHPLEIAHALAGCQPYTAYVATMAYMRDVWAWNDVMEEYGLPVNIAVCWPYSSNANYRLWPSVPPSPGVVMPFPTNRNDYIIRTTGYPNTLENFISLFEQIKGDENTSEPDSVLCIVDISGSMTQANLEPGITQFFTWLDEKEVPNRCVTINDERWMRWVAVWHAFNSTRDPEDISLWPDNYTGFLDNY